MWSFSRAYDISKQGQVEDNNVNVNYHHYELDRKNIAVLPLFRNIMSIPAPVKLSILSVYDTYKYQLLIHVAI